jgi:cobalt-zinc-cadmium efflux system membrane fusion protein
MKRIWTCMIALSLVWLAACGKQKETPSEEHGEKAEAKKDEHVVTLSEEARAAAKIQVAEVRRDSAWMRAQFPGRIDFNKNVTAFISPTMEGRLQQWRVSLGDKVKAGDELAQMQNPQNLDHPITLKAPIDGEIVERNSALGAWVKPEDTLFVISDLSTVWAIAEVREDMVGKVRQDVPATIRVLSYSNETFEGKLWRIAPRVEAETRTVEFSLEVPNPDRKLRAGMFAYVSLATERVENALLVPDDAVQTVRDQPVVFVEEQPGKYRVTEVRLGRKLGDQQEVLTGVTEGAKVVIAGSIILKSEALRSELQGE